MVNEMGNKNSSQLANREDTVRGINQINREGQGKDYPGKVEGLPSDNQPDGGDLPVAKRTSSNDKEQDDTKLKISSQSTEALPVESGDEASRDSSTTIQTAAAASPTDAANHLEKETEANLEENLSVKRPELPGTNITEDRQETETKDEVENGFDNKSSEATSKGTSSNTFEEAPQTQDKSMPLTENKDKTYTKQAVNELNTTVDSSQSELVMVGSDSGNGKENVENRGLTEMTPVMETIPTELPTTECNNEEVKEKVIKAIEEDSGKQELDTGIYPSAASEAEDSGGVELRKSPSFGFDLSTETRPGESDQTPLLHNNNKTRTRSLSLFDGANSTVANLSTQNQAAVSAEEKTIEVERTDLDRSRAPLLNFLKEEDENGTVAVEPKKQDCEKKGVEESCTRTSKEVALTNGSGNNKPRGFTRFICCAAGTD